MPPSRPARSQSLARGAAVITAATAVSRVTGFARVVVVAATLGTTFLANTYQTANSAPNVLFELVAAGVLTSVFVPTFVSYLVRGEEREGWEAADALTSVALVGLTLLAILVAIAAPLVMRVLTVGVADPLVRAHEVALGAVLLRLFAPQVIFYGVGMIMTAALQAHRRFAMAAIAPIFNNVIVIAVYLIYAAMRGSAGPSIAGVTPAQEWVLGGGTTLGVVAMTICLAPQLVRLGWHFRFRFDLSHPAVRKGARLGLWALSYAGGYQVGLIVVLVLANKVQGGVAAYQWAYTFFYLPYALFAVPIFNVLFPEMSEHVAKGEESRLIQRLRDGLKMIAFILLPTAAILLATAGPLANITLQYGVMTGAGAAMVARVIAGFSIGLPGYSTFLVLTRGYYAMADTKTPALVNAATVVIASATGALLFVVLPPRWAVAGLALGHSLAFTMGAIVLGILLGRRTHPVTDPSFSISVRRSVFVTVLATLVMAAIVSLLSGPSKAASLASLAVAVTAGLAVYAGAMVRLGSPELARVGALIGRRTG
ncbi:MAG: putative peptidoglycan lipid flippase [Actinomycetota bacterium]|jgi:putative peptidoglycan lipid II flippase|nr:putative peptidoglycan lipid flippase [Actinomycetota bacterium]